MTELQSLAQDFGNILDSLCTEKFKLFPDGLKRALCTSDSCFDFTVILQVVGHDTSKKFKFQSEWYFPTIDLEGDIVPASSYLSPGAGKYISSVLD